MPVNWYQFVMNVAIFQKTRDFFKLFDSDFCVALLTNKLFNSCISILQFVFYLSMAVL